MAQLFVDTVVLQSPAAVGRTVSVIRFVRKYDGVYNGAPRTTEYTDIGNRASQKLCSTTRDTAQLLRSDSVRSILQ